MQSLRYHKTRKRPASQVTRPPSRAATNLPSVRASCRAENSEDGEADNNDAVEVELRETFSTIFGDAASRDVDIDQEQMRQILQRADTETMRRLLLAMVELDLMECLADKAPAAGDSSDERLAQLLDEQKALRAEIHIMQRRAATPSSRPELAEVLRELVGIAPPGDDIEGRINNFIDVTDFDAYTGDENFLERRGAVKDDDEKYTREIPDLDEYTKDPPPLPPHLRHIILNKAPPSGDPNALPVPQHVALNHLYCTAIKDGMMVLGVTLRYRQKACTTVYYSVS